MDLDKETCSILQNECPNFGQETICPASDEECPCPGRKLRRETIHIQEMEAKRWAMELHDGILPLIANLNMEIEYCTNLAREGSLELQKQISAIKKHGNIIYQELHNLCTQLRPSALADDKTLIKMIYSYVKDFCFENKLQYEIILPDKIDINFNKSVNIILFRVLQECLNNIKKHAKAQKVIIELKPSKNKCTLIVKDNGVGFDTSTLDETSLLNSGKIGIMNLYERAKIMGGKLEISSKHEQGTTVAFTLPWLGKFGSDLGCL